MIALAPTTLPNTEPLEYIRAAAEVGYDGVGLRLYRSPVYPSWFPIVGDAQLMREVKSAMVSSKLAMLDVFTFYLQPDTDLEAMRRALEFGAELGAKYGQLIGDDPDWARMVDNYGRYCDICRELNMFAAIEAPVNSRVVNSIPLALKLIADCGRDNAGIVLDPGQFHRAGHSPDLLKGHSPALFPYTQLNDVEGPPPAPRCCPGDGIVPLVEILDALPADLPLSVEWSAPKESNYSAVEWARIALEGTQKFLHGYYSDKK